MNAEGTALANDAVEQHGSGLGNAIFFGEEFLEFIDHEQRTGNLFRAACAFVTRNVLNAEFPEEIAATPQFGIDAFEDAKAELSIALDGHNARVRQAAGGVALEF